MENLFAKKKMRQSDTSHIPEDVLADILSRLSVKSVKRFCIVSKPWLSLFSHPTFIKLHFTRSLLKLPMLLLGISDPACSSQFAIVNPDDLPDEPILLNFQESQLLNVLGCCNGLFLLSEFRKPRILCLLNPSTRELVQLPSIPYKVWSSAANIMFAFGYVYDFDVYKVVASVSTHDHGCEVWVYTLGKDSWTSVEGPPSRPCHSNNLYKVYVNGFLHWMCDCHSQAITSFDLKNEKFGKTPFPDLDARRWQGQGWTTENLVLGVLEGCLIILHERWFERGNCKLIDLWMMKSFGSWFKLYSVSIETTIGHNNLDPLVICKKNHYILVHSEGACVAFYDIVTKTNRDCGSCGPSYCIRPYAYVEALTSIASLMREKGREWH